MKFPLLQNDRETEPDTPIRYLFVFLFGILMAFSGCGRTLQQQNTQPNIILISIDTLRADHLHGYGYPRETSPVLDDLMRQGSSFLTTISQSPWTLPSHLSIFTGLYPHVHGVTEDTLVLNEQVVTLPMLMQEMGYRTGGFSACDYLAAKHGFGKGFDTYNQRRGIRAPAVCEEALKWMTREKPEKYFLFLHFYDVHPDYEPSENFLKMFETSSYNGIIRGTIRNLLNIREGAYKANEDDKHHLVALYDGEIRQLDHEIGVFFSFLRGRGFLDNTVIIITSDHGEEFFEHGNVLHSRTLYDEVLKVPLIITGPNIPAGRKIHSQVQLIDVMPTILDICGAATPDIDGRSLLPLLKEESAKRPEFAFAEADKDNEAPDIKRAIRSNRYKLYYDIQSQNEELYDIVEDPKEQVNLIGVRPDARKALSARLQEWMATKRGNPGEVPLTEDEKRELRSLGYMN